METNIKICKFCKKELKQRFDETSYSFQRRQFCGMICSTYSEHYRDASSTLGITNLLKKKIKHCTICKKEYELVGNIERSNNRKTCGDAQCRNKQITITSGKYKDQRREWMNKHIKYLDQRFKRIQKRAFRQFKEVSIYSISQLPEEY